MDKRISIIVPVYNVEKYLTRCIDSILAQTYQNIEVILVNDGSTDSSPAICDEYAQKDARISVIHKENGGLSSARNAGLDAATGEYIGFVDSDDFIAPDMYANLLKTLDSDKVGIANCMYVRAFDSGKTADSRVPHNQNECISRINYLEELLLHVGDVSVCTKLFSHQIIGDIRFPEGKLNEDFPFMVRLSENIENIQFVGQVGYYYYVRENSITARYGKSFVDMQENALWMFDYIQNHYPTLIKQALRFALYQNMAYLLAVSRTEAVTSNKSYVSALHFVRKNYFKIPINPYLKTKEKIILLGQGVAPKLMATIFECKRRK